MPELRQFIGCPFKNGGRGEKDPVTRLPLYDCYGLFLAIYKEYGIELPDFKISCFATDEIKKKYEEERGKWERIKTPEIPCAVALSSNHNRPGVVCHFGVYIGGDRFIHALNRTRSIVSNIHDEVWNRKIEGFYRWKKS